MINLYLFNELSRASVYGIGTYLNELVNALKKKEININVIYLNSDKDEIQETVEDGVSYWYLPSACTESITPKRNLYYANVVYWLRIHIKNTENLIFHLNYNQNSKLADILKNVFVCRIITVVHYSNWGFSIFDNPERLRSILNKEYPDEFEKKLKESVEEEKLLYAKVDHVICLSEYMRQILHEDYQLESSAISVIPNGLKDVVDGFASKRYLRKKWKLSVKDKILLFVGRIDAIKGVEYIIGSFREVLKVYPQCRLIIAGDGSFKLYLDKAQDICTRITYTGLLEKQQLYELYQLADIGIIASLFEPFGYVAVEMMMHRLPIIATATSGLNEVIDEACGLKVPVSQLADSVEIDVPLMTEKILYLLQHPVEAGKMGRKGRERYLKEYSSEVFCGNMLQLYESLC